MSGGERRGDRLLNGDYGNAFKWEFHPLSSFLVR
jgi:hypothetical protein